MADLPYMQFYPADWLADTRMLTASAKGVWIDTLAALWNAPERGFLKRTERAWGRLWGVEPERVPQLLEELEDVAEVRRDPDGVLIASRRMVRDEIERERSRNSKRAEEKREWNYREAVSRSLPEMLPADSRKPPAEFPADSRPVPGERLETRDQKMERERKPAGVRRPTLQQAVAAAGQFGVTPDKADEWWHAREASEWMKGTAGGGTTPVGTNWQADLKTYASRSGMDTRRPEHRQQKAATEYPEKPTTSLPRA